MNTAYYSEKIINLSQTASFTNQELYQFSVNSGILEDCNLKPSVLQKEKYSCGDFDIGKISETESSSEEQDECFVNPAHVMKKSYLFRQNQNILKGESTTDKSPIFMNKTPEFIKYSNRSILQ